MRERSIRSTPLLLTAVCSMILIGCEQNAQYDDANDTAEQSTSIGQGNQSSLGKAKESAENVVNDMQQRSQDIADDFDE